jgi:hypothetical protein
MGLKSADKKGNLVLAGADRMQIQSVGKGRIEVKSADLI